VQNNKQASSDLPRRLRPISLAPCSRTRRVQLDSAKAAVEMHALLDLLQGTMPAAASRHEGSAPKRNFN